MTATDQATYPVSFRPAEFEVFPDGSGRILGSRCRTCGVHFFPIRGACSRCLGTDLEKVRFSTTGTPLHVLGGAAVDPAFAVPYVLGVCGPPGERPHHEPDQRVRFGGGRDRDGARTWPSSGSGRRPTELPSSATGSDR